MAVVRPFCALRPAKELVDKVAALPYDVYTTKEAIEIAKDNPYSFLHVDKAEIDLDLSIDIYDKKVYEKAKKNLNKMIDQKILIMDNTPYFYIYRQQVEGRTQTGIVACASIDEYINGKIKKHELTREDKEKDRINHVKYCGAQTGPIFLVYKSQDDIKKLINSWVNSHDPEYSFLSDDNVNNTIWVVNDNNVINELVKMFGSVNTLYIADGHHRNAAAVKTGLDMRLENPEYVGNEEFNYYLSVIFPDDELYILDYNRIIKDLNGFSIDEVLKKLSDKFDIEKMDDIYKPDKIHCFSFYCDGDWYKLKSKSNIISNDVILGLDVSILQNEVLAPIFGINDPRKDKRIDFVGGIRGLAELKKRVDSGEMAAAFALFPTSIGELFAVADENKIMPPKSTWFEPKLRSGLFIHKI